MATSILKYTQCILTALFVCCSLPAQANNSQTDTDDDTKVYKPLWELGLGVAAARFPHYPGSDQHRNLAVPFPFFVFRGNILRANRGGLSAWFLDQPGTTLTLSARASLPVGKENRARNDNNLPELDFAFEVGPQLGQRLWQSKSGSSELWFRLPLRAQFSTDFSSIDAQGLSISPHMRLYKDLTPNLEVRLSLGMQFANKKFHGYYYNVNSDYQAPGGYSGAISTASLSWKTGKWSLTSFLSFWALERASYQDSPLVKKKTALYSGLAISRMFFQSKQPSGILEHTHHSTEND